jgi:hypothetical protein
MRKSLQVYRRGAIYWWRQIFPAGVKKIEIRFSLQTLDPTTAKRRAAAMIMATGAVMEMLELMMRPLDARPTEKELKVMAKAAYQQQLARTMERQRENPEQREMHRVFNRAYCDFYQFLEDTGGNRPIARADIDRLEAEGWSVERLEQLAMVSHQHFSEQRSISVRTIDGLLEEHGFQPQPGLRRIVERALYPAYKKACVVADAYWEPPVEPATKLGTVVASLPVAPHVPDRWRGKTVQDAMRFFFEEAKSGKTFDAKRRHQALDSAWLLDECSGGKAAYEVTNGHLKALRKAYDDLPVNRGKSSADKGLSLADWTARGKEMKLAQKKAASQANKEPRARRAGRVGPNAQDQGQFHVAPKDKVGLSPGTINRHSGHLQQLYVWLQKGEQLPIQSLYWEDMKQTDTEDERNKKDPWSDDEARAIFELPVWTGCSGLTPKKRLLTGTIIVHDSAYWIPLLAWYEGVRREEVSKTLLYEVESLFDIPGLRIDDSETGRVKTARSRRFVPLHKELIRLGFLNYVEAVRDAGCDLLFPELEPGDKKMDSSDQSEGKISKKYGDNFYSLWWRYIVKSAFPEGTSKDIQSFRHSATDGLLRAGVPPKTTADGFGRKMGNLTEDRYASATAVRKLKMAFDMIPVVTAHLQPEPIKLLPADKLRRRPNRRPRTVKP